MRTTLDSQHIYSRNVSRQYSGPITARIFYLMLRLLIVALFSQIWVEIGGFTVRAEDVITLIIIALSLSPILLTGQLPYRRNILNIPLLLWCCVLLIGIVVTVSSPFDGETKKNAVVNGLRLIFSFGLFFAVYNFPAHAERKLKIVVTTTVLVSFVTTIASLLQIGHTDGWLPYSLPDVLTALKEGANTAQGREIFGLFIGDTGSHTWAGALAIQALLIWVISRYARRPLYKTLSFLYFGLLVLILIRISVRNSILGLFVAIVGIEFVRYKSTRYQFLRATYPIIFLVVAVGLIIGLLTLGADSYFVERVRVTIPQLQNGELQISRASNLFGRLEYWATALNIFGAHPILGGGYYSFGTLSAIFGPRSIVHAHNSYVQTFAEFGIVGATVAVVLIVSISYYLYRTRRILRAYRRGSMWWEFVTGSVLLLAFTMLFANSFGIPNYIAFRAVSFGVLASLVREIPH